MKKPLIGISSGVVNDMGSLSYGPEKAELNMSYVQAVVLAGGVPLILPPLADQEMIKILSLNIDGLLLSGGIDVDPLLYREQPEQNLGSVCRERDVFEMEIVKAVSEQNKPVFGICRGAQVINVTFGGTLYQDINRLPGCWVKHTQQAKGYLPTHDLTLADNSVLAGIIGNHKLTCNSFHHQSVKDVAPGFKVTAWAADGIMEAFESCDDKQILTVQWHPERMATTQAEARKLFEWLVLAAQKQMGNKH